MYRFSIYLVNLEPVIGSEQGKTRPALIISNEEINRILPVINILPITSYKENRKIYANEVFLEKDESKLEKDSIILCYQIRTVDKKRLIKKIGEVSSEEVREEIIESLGYQLDIWCMLYKKYFLSEN